MQCIHMDSHVFTCIPIYSLKAYNEEKKILEEKNLEEKKFGRKKFWRRKILAKIN